MRAQTRLKECNWVRTYSARLSRCAGIRSVITWRLGAGSGLTQRWSATGPWNDSSRRRDNSQGGASKVGSRNSCIDTVKHATLSASPHRAPSIPPSLPCSLAALAPQPAAPPLIVEGDTLAHVRAARSKAGRCLAPTSKRAVPSGAEDSLSSAAASIPTWAVSPCEQAEILLPSPQYTPPPSPCPEPVWTEALATEHERTVSRLPHPRCRNLRQGTHVTGNSHASAYNGMEISAKH